MRYYHNHVKIQMSANVTNLGNSDFWDNRLYSATLIYINALSPNYKVDF